MSSLQQLMDETQGWLNRRDVASLMPGWIQMVETQLGETLRSRCQVTSAYQDIDSDYIALPSDFATMESIRDASTGVMLELKDSWSGNWFDPQQDDRNTQVVWYNPTPPVSTAYRLMANCIEFLPHPKVPDPPDPTWVPQRVFMAWYAKPRPLLLPSDTNPILEQHYGVYLFGVMKYGALFELDDDRAAQADAAWKEQVTQANLWKQQSDYSGAPYRAEMACNF